MAAPAIMQLHPSRAHAPAVAGQLRPALLSQRPACLGRGISCLPVQRMHRARQPVSRANSQQSQLSAPQHPTALHKEDSTVIDVTPDSAVDIEATYSTASFEAQSPTAADVGREPQWQQLGRRLLQGAAMLAVAMALVTLFFLLNPFRIMMERAVGATSYLARAHQNQNQLAGILRALAPLSGSALAASSGGRMGGSSFSAARSFGGSSSGSFSGSLGGGSSMSRSYGGGGYSRGSSAPSLTMQPRTSFSWGYGPGFYGGYGGGYGAPVVSSGGGGGGLFTLLTLGVLAFAAFQLLPSLGGGSDESGYGRMTVAKVQVGLTGTARGLQKELERIAKRADTNSPEGLHFVLQETVLALLRHPEYCIYGAASTKGTRGLDAAEERFNSASMEERGKFQEETLSNVGGRTRNNSGQGRFSRGSRSSTGDELIVVTILVAADGDLKIPNISSQEQLRTTLNRLGGLRSDQVMAVEVLWTPQDDGDYFTRDDLMVDYPKLNTL